jgi:hypothetical protein
MANKKPHSDWVIKSINRIESNWDDKTQTVFTIVLSIALVIVPFTFVQLLSLLSEERTMNTPDPILSVPSLVTIALFYIIGFCIIMLIRNANKSQTDKRLDKQDGKLNTMVILLTAIAKKQGVDTDSILKDLENNKG